MAEKNLGECAEGCRCIKHDDLCSSDDNLNSKATQHSAADKSESMAAAARLSSEEKSTNIDDDLTSASERKPTEKTPDRNFTLFSFDKDGGVDKQDIRFGDPRRIDMLFDAAFPSTTNSPSSVKHKYIVESTITRSPLQFRSPIVSKLDGVSIKSCSTNQTSGRRHTVPTATEGIDSLLSEINQRCKTSDSVSIDMQNKLHTKNQQLSEQCVLLERAEENLAKLQNQLSEERKSKSEIKGRLEKLLDERRELQDCRRELDDALSSLRQEIQSADVKLSERAKTITVMAEEIKELKKAKQALEQEACTLNQLKEDQTITAEKLEAMGNTLDDKEQEINKLKAQVSKEEKNRKAAEKEAQLVTQQGQSLMEQQKAIRSQYQEDITAHQQRVHTLEDLVAQLEKQTQNLNDQLKSKEKVNRESLASMVEKLESTKEIHELQREKDRSEIANLGRQLEAKIIVENMLQGTITNLKEQHMNTEQKLTAAQERLKTENQTLKSELDNLKRRHEEEMKLSQKKLNDTVNKRKESFDLQVADFEANKRKVTKENIDLKCRIAELEERLEDRETVMSSLKDTIQELSEFERRATAEYNDLKSEHQHTQEKKDKILDQKVKEIDELRKSICKFESESNKTMLENHQEIKSLRSQLNQLTEEKEEMERELVSKSHELSAIKEALDEAQKSAEQLTSMRALLSKKESSKNILVAEQQRMEREYSTALSQKTSEVNTLEQEVRALQQENAILKSKRGSGETDVVQRATDRSVLTTNSNASVKQNPNAGADALTRSMLARRESSNQILAAENKKVKEELKNANTWWQRDVNELQRRHANQASVITNLERKMTGLEMENTQLKRNSIETYAPASPRAMSQASNYVCKETQPATGAYENLLDHYKKELSIKESKIKSLEASLRSARGDNTAAIQKLESATEQEQGMKVALESKLSQNELDAEKLHSNLTEAENLLELKDLKAAENTLRQSNADLRILLANIKQTNQSATCSLEIAAEKQACLIKLHHKFSQTLTQIQKDAAAANTHQKNEIDALNKHYEAQLQQLKDTIQRLSNNVKEKAEENSVITAQRIEAERALHQAEEQIRDVKSHSQKAHHDLEIARASKQSADSRVEELEKKSEYLQQHTTQLETKLQMSKTECAIVKEREAALMKSKYEAKLAKLVEGHQKEIKDITSKIRSSEKRNSQLVTEVSKLQEKIGNESRPLEKEVQDLHGKVHKLSLEKSELEERFKVGLATLKDDHDVILCEKANYMHRLHCNISELEAKVCTLHEELNLQKETNSKCQDELRRCKLAALEEAKKLTDKLTQSKNHVKQLTESLDMEKRQLAKTLDNLTNLEVEYVKLHNQAKHSEDTTKNLEVKYQGTIERLKADLAQRTLLQKQTQNENKLLKSTLKTLESEIKMGDEKLAIFKHDIQHAESVAQLYRKQFEAIRKESDQRVSVRQSIHNSPRLPSPKPISFTHFHQVRADESSEELGSKVADLTNQIMQLKNENCLLRKQNELTEQRLKDQIDSDVQSADTLKAIAKQRDEYQKTMENMTAQLEGLQQQMRHSRADNESLRSSFDSNVEKLEKVRKELAYVAEERTSLEKKLSDTTVLKKMAEAKAANEEELQKYNSELKRRLQMERDSACKIEQNMREQMATMQKELITLRQNMDDAHQANRSLERYIKNMKQTFSQVYYDAEDYDCKNRQSSGFLSAMTLNERKESLPSKKLCTDKSAYY